MRHLATVPFAVFATGLAGLVAVLICLPFFVNDPQQPITSVSKAHDVNEDESIEKQLLEIAKSYKYYGRVDDEVRWSPHLCRIPQPSLARFSKSDDSDTHGQKLYFLFAKQREEYLAYRRQDQPIGQIIVKESWIPKEYTGTDAPSLLMDATAEDEKYSSATGEQASFPIGIGQYFEYAQKDGTWYKTGEQADLFVMLKLDATDYDEGWVYGVVTADATKVKASGIIDNCQSCHVDAERDRMFGLK